MRRKKGTKGLKLLAIAIIAASIAGFFILRKDMGKAPHAMVKQQTGYKMEDRKNLEKIIHEEAGND